MELEQIAKILIIVHVICGGLGLGSGVVTLAAPKGKLLHRRMGLLFYFSMILSALSALCLCIFPEHENVFLFLVGIFSLYFVLSGRRALKYRKPDLNLTIDYLISIVMIACGIAMIIYPLATFGELNIVLTSFSVLGSILAVQDLKLFQDRQKLKEIWLSQHLSKMLGGFISATTAFVVVNEFLPGVVGWLAPGVVGGIFIAYWTRKIRKPS